ncbi:MAG: GNAT family N-acetyltransferase [Turicibacter sp.]
MILNQLTLKSGEVLVLRFQTIQDAENIVAYLNAIGGESDNLLFGKGEFRLSIDAVRKIIEDTNQDDHKMKILGTINDEIVSMAQLSCPSHKRIEHNGEFSISVRKAYWNKGVGSAMMSELIAVARTNPMIKTVSLGVKSDNDHAMKLYEKFGFEKVGVHKNYINVEGRFYDEILMDLYL